MMIESVARREPDLQPDEVLVHMTLTSIGDLLAYDAEHPFLTDVALRKLNDAKEAVETAWRRACERASGATERSF